MSHFFRLGRIGQGGLGTYKGLEGPEHVEEVRPGLQQVCGLVLAEARPLSAFVNANGSEVPCVHFKNFQVGECDGRSVMRYSGISRLKGISKPLRG